MQNTDDSQDPSGQGDDDARDETTVGMFEQFHKAQTEADLPTPEVEPALALTNNGWYEWLDGASEWTPLPSWWTRQLGAPDHHVPEGYIRQFNDTLYLSPGADIAAAIEDVDGGRIVLEKGRFEIGRQVRVPGNVVIEGQGIESRIVPAEDTDLFRVGGDFPSGTGNTAALRNLAIDTTDIRDYTSTVVTFTDDEVYHGGIEFLQDVVFHMPNSGERGTAIALVDGSGNGVSSVTFGNVRILFPDVAIHLEVNQGGFVNGNASRNVWVRTPRIGIREVVNEGVIRSNDWNFRVNGNPDIERVLVSRGDRNRYRLFAFDLNNMEGPAITVEGNRNVLHNQGGSPLLWRWVADSGFGNVYEDLSKTDTYLPQENLPYWLDTLGEGELVGDGDEARLVPGSSTGDEFAVTSTEGLFSTSRYPWLQLSFDFDDGLPRGVSRLGFAEPDSGGAYIVADPDDALGGGHGDEFVTLFGTEADGSVEPTGVSFHEDSYTLGIRVTQGSNWGEFDLLWMLDGERVRFERGLASRDLSPWVSIRNTGSSQPVLDIEDLVELRYDGRE